MSLFITRPGLHRLLIDRAKVGILIASVAAAVIGTVLLLMAPAGTGAPLAGPAQRPASSH